MLVTPENHNDIFWKLSRVKVLAADTETSGLEWGDRLFAVIISTDTGDYYFDKRVLTVNFRWVLEILFGDPTKTWLFKNAKFDMRMLHHEGIRVRGAVEDIGIAARILKNDHMKYSLADLAKREGMEKLDIAKEYIKEHKLYELRTTRTGEIYKQPQFDKIPLEVISEYACKDARLTYDLRQLYLSRMDDDDLKVYANECKLIKVCFDMEMTGVQLDLTYTQRGMSYEKEELAKKKRYFLQATGREYKDSKGILVPIFEGAGEVVPLTDKGNPSLTDDVLENFASPIAKHVQDIRFSEKRIATYYTNYIDGHDSSGRIHPTMWQEGTRTGRFSYSNPNLQNIPKKEDAEAPFVIRGCFVPTPGNILVSFDYSQMEYRMMLAYAEEHRLIREVMNGADVHTATAELLSISRDPAKTLNFAILYGSGPEQISRMLSVPLPDASRLRTKYFLGLPKVERLISNIISVGITRGFVKTWYGRKLRAHREFCYALPNHLIQGGCADVVKIAMNEIDDLLDTRTTNMILQVHDQLVFDMAPQDFELVPQIKEIMENVWPAMNGMKLLVDVEYSDKSFAARDMKKGIPK